jgi:hypothetical protein
MERKKESYRGVYYPETLHGRCLTSVRLENRIHIVLLSRRLGTLTPTLVRLCRYLPPARFPPKPQPETGPFCFLDLSGRLSISLLLSFNRNLYALLPHYVCPL